MYNRIETIRSACWSDFVTAKYCNDVNVFESYYLKQIQEYTNNDKFYLNNYYKDYNKVQYYDNDDIEKVAISIFYNTYGYLPYDDRQIKPYIEYLNNIRIKMMNDNSPYYDSIYNQYDNANNLGTNFSITMINEDLFKSATVTDIPDNICDNMELEDFYNMIERNVNEYFNIPTEKITILKRCSNYIKVNIVRKIQKKFNQKYNKLLYQIE